MRRSLIVAAALLVLAAAAQEPDLVLRISVALVQVDAVVTDSKGRLVTGLTADDFEIRQDGQPQKITHFNFVELPRPAAAPAPAPKSGVPAPPVKLRPNQVRRTMALVVDDLALSFESIARVRQALKKFVDEQMEPGDLVAILRTGAGMGALQQFTADKRQLYAAIERVRYNPFGRLSIGTFGSTEMEGAELRADEFREELFSVGTLGAINFVVRGLKDLPGRKSVILFSDNLRIINSEGLNTTVADALQRLTDLANRASVVIYSIDPRGLQTLMPDAAANVQDVNPASMAEALMKRRSDHFDSQQGMFYLAHETGGMFVHNDNDISQGIRQVLDDQAGYYLIGYRPDPATFDPETGRGKFHKVSVRVKRPGLRVRSRNGFFGVPERDARPARRTREEQMAAALTSPFAGGEIRLKLTSLFSAHPKTGSFLHSMLHIGAQGMKFEKDAEGWYKGVTDVLMVAFGDNGQEVDRTNRTYTVRVRGNAYRTMMRNGFVFSVRHPVKKPGAYQLRVAVRDALSGRVGSASQFVEVPDVRKNRLTLSGIAVKSFVPQDRPGAAETEGHLADVDPEGNAAVRIFHRGKALAYACQVLNAKPGPDRKPQVETQIRLFHEGKQVYDGKRMDLDPALQADFKHMLAGGRLQLGAKMPTGEYILQVRVTDKLARGKDGTATQWIDFEVAP
ncbi:MAG: VWA domain-containing protein [Bryobacteraceae bacterium]